MRAGAAKLKATQDEVHQPCKHLEAFCFRCFGDQIGLLFRHMFLSSINIPVFNDRAWFPGLI